MKTRDWLIIGAATAAGYYYFTTQKGLGNIAGSAANDLANGAANDISGIVSTGSGDLASIIGSLQGLIAGVFTGVQQAAGNVPSISPSGAAPSGAAASNGNSIWSQLNQAILKSTTPPVAVVQSGANAATTQYLVSQSAGITNHSTIVSTASSPTTGVVVTQMAGNPAFYTYQSGGQTVVGAVPASLLSPSQVNQSVIANEQYLARIGAVSQASAAQVIAGLH